MTRERIIFPMVNHNVENLRYVIKVEINQTSTLIKTTLRLLKKYVHPKCNFFYSLKLFSSINTDVSCIGTRKVNGTRFSCFKK